jgi:hypothetical protein
MHTKETSPSLLPLKIVLSRNKIVFEIFDFHSICLQGVAIVEISSMSTPANHT